MNKLYQRINWQNYPSDSTPLNESNLNKMDAAVDGIDDRVVTLDVTKLPVSTANTMVKDVTFNETTGVFTITKLNGTKVTVNTALEKIATNFRYDHSTQKLILTLIDGTTQEVDLSALLTQYEFLNSSTIQFTIDSSGKVKASVVNGSITGDMLEPNYLANVTLQASKADTSAKNAKESEEKAAEYAESAKNSADSAEPVASTATGTNPTAQNSTNAPFVYGKFKGYTKQQMYSGKNLIDTSNLKEDTVYGVTFTPIYENGMLQYVNVNGTATANSFLTVGYAEVTAGVKYIISGCPSGGNWGKYTFHNPGNGTVYDYGNGVEYTPVESIRTGFTILVFKGVTVDNIKFYPMVRLASVSDATYEPYVGGIASPNPEYPQEINGLAKDGAIEVKTCGKNLIDTSNLKEDTVYGVTFTPIYENGMLQYVNVNGTATANSFLTVGYAEVTAGVKYIISGCPSGGNWGKYMFHNPDNGTVYDYGNGVEYTPVESIRTGFTIFVFRGVTVDNIKFYPMVRLATETDDTYEPYTETTANIPTDAPLYEGDYLEVYADGSGRLVRAMADVVLDGSDDENLTAYTTGIKGNFIQLLLNDIKQGANLISSQLQVANPYNNAGSCIYALTTNNGIWFRISDDITSVADTRAWLRSKPMTVVYELAEPTETPLTAEQVEQFKKLYTFEPVTNVLCDGEVEMIYLKNTNGGKALASVRRGVEHADTATTATTATKATQDGNGNVIAETYYRKANFDKIVGGTVEPSGKTNVVYSVPTEVSSKGVVVQTNTSGTLINALSKATASISGFFSILYNAVKTKYLGRIDLGMSAIQNTYDFTSFAGYDRYTLVFKGKDANRSLYTRELLTIHNIEKNTSNVGKVCLNIPNNYTFEPWVEMYQSRDKTYIVVQLTDTTGLTTLVSSLYVEVYGAMD